MQDAPNREPNIDLTRRRENQTQLYLEPFGFALTNQMVRSQAAESHVPILLPFITAGDNAALQSTAPTDKAPIKLNGFAPARVVWQRNKTYEVEVATSRVTKRKYRKYIVDRFSCPFGAKNASSDMISAFNDIKTLLLAEAQYEINRVSLIPEKGGPTA